LIESSLDVCTDSLAIEGDWLTVTSSSEDGSLSSSKSGQFSKHLLNISFKQSLVNDLTEIECMITQLMLTTPRVISSTVITSDPSITNEELVTVRREVRDILALLIQPRFLKSLEIVTNTEYHEQ
jgi:hypothetical protein